MTRFEKRRKLVSRNGSKPFHLRYRLLGEKTMRSKNEDLLRELFAVKDTMNTVYQKILESDMTEEEIRERGFDAIKILNAVKDLIIKTP
ncbi:hypothetical protein UFOVP81_8 [uncultured Caudovirales phage]|uniref:Uncharacterized protein n=1 Tax=uncultured Caudovirales phage TaxID=2100421 RepID=A0A6J5KVQ5_9CAUD|nr:hypothetical protein UFOVP81_8 [uncultured Caudovirales phage]